MFHIYTVSVDSEDMYEGEWNDLVIVATVTEEKAKTLAKEWVADQRDTREFGQVEAYKFRFETSKVLGRLDTDT